VDHFRIAAKLDPEFALADVYLAQSEGTARAFFDNLEKAASLSGKVSEAEREMILGWQAGASGQVAKQREHWGNAVRLFPEDERALTQLGTNHFGQQEYKQAAELYIKAVTINPDFAPAYNQLGYTQRFLGDYVASENAFKKYTTLIPDDPNPYDSYAELLLKLGRFDESIAMYRKALAVDKNFTASRIGIAAALMYQDKPADARREMNAVLDNAQDDTDRRQALFVSTLSYLEEGNTDAALKEMKKQYALGEKISDAAAMAGDLVAMGTINFEAGNIAAAEELYKKALDVFQKSTLSEDVKSLNRLGSKYNTAVIAAAKGNIDAAKKEAEQLAKGAESLGNKFQIRLAHELKARIALAEKNYAAALKELEQANQQNPYNLYRSGQAFEGMGKKEEAKAKYKAAAEFNGLPNLNYALIRHKAKASLSGGLSAR